MAKVFLVANGNKFVAVEHDGDVSSISFDGNLFHTDETNIPYWNGEPLMKKGDIVDHIIENITYIKEVKWFEETGELRFIYQDDETEKSVIVPSLDIIKDIDYDHSNRMIQLITRNDDILEVSVEDLVDIYTGSEGDEITVEVEINDDEDNRIKAFLNEHAVSWEHLTVAMRELITGLESRVSSAQTSIENINQDITDIWEDITDIENTVTEQKARVDGNEGDVERIDGVLNDMVYVTEVEQVADREIEFTYQDGSTYTATIPEPEELDLSDIEERLDIYEGDVITINEEITDIETNITEIETNITNIDNRVTVVEGKITNIQDFIRDLEYVKDVEYEISTGEIKVTLHTGAEVDIRIPHLDLIDRIDYDHGTSTITITKRDGETIDVNVYELVDTYEGSEGDEIEIEVNDNVIEAKLLEDSVTYDHLEQELKDKFDAVLVTDVFVNEGKVEVTYSDGREEDFLVYPTFCVEVPAGGTYNLNNVSIPSSKVFDIKYAATQTNTGRYELGTVTFTNDVFTTFNVVKSYVDRGAFTIQEGVFSNNSDQQVKLSGMVFPLDFSCDEDNEDGEEDTTTCDVCGNDPCTCEEEISFDNPCEDNPTASGNLNDSINWWICPDKTLYINGVGEMPNYSISPFRDHSYIYNSFDNVIIGGGVTSIGDAAFNGCISLQTIIIPNSVISIGSSAFNGCNNLSSIAIPDSVTSIGYSAFVNCKSLTSVTIPNSVTSIEYGTFQECNNLTSVTIPDSVTSIGESAFSYTNLSSIAIPDSVNSIGAHAFNVCGFNPCSTLTSVTCYAVSPLSINVQNVFYNSNLSNCTLYVPEESISAYTQSNWGVFGNIQPI